MKKGYVYAMMAAVAAMTVSGCSSSSSAPASTAAESKTEAAASSESGTTAADTSDVKAAVDTIKFGLVAPLSGYRKKVMSWQWKRSTQVAVCWEPS